MEAIGVAALLGIMAVTFTDVAGTKIFLMPLPGSIDMAMMLQVLAISAGVASTLIAGGHVRMTFFLMKLPKTISVRIGLGIDLLCLLLFMIVGWRLACYGYRVYLEGEVSPTAHMPLYPFAFGIMLSMIPVSIEMSIRIFQRVQEILSERSSP
jgi:TRAP-type C4-dicarboxylate transport system permease small subunit